MAIVHTFLGSLLQSHLLWGFSIVLTLLIFLLSKFNKIDLSGFLPLKLVLIGHLVYHIIGTFFNTNLYPMWFIWLELILVLITFIVNISMNRLKGLFTFAMCIVGFISLSIFVDMAFGMANSSFSVILVVIYLYLVFNI